MSLIVVEGCDASGKSTLLENARLEIKDRYFIQMRHSCRPLTLGHAIGFMRTANQGAAMLDVIVDRHPLISEPVYGSILRKQHLFSDHFVYGSEEQRFPTLRESVDRLIYCRPPNHVIEENLGNRPQLAGVSEKIWDILDEYDRLIEKLYNFGLPIRTYDYTVETDSLQNIFFGKLL